jgi:hypothetical protein
MIDDAFTGEVRVELLNALDRLIEGEGDSVGPEEFALPGVQLDFLFDVHELPKSIVDVDRSLAVGRIHPFNETVNEGIGLARMLLPWLSHGKEHSTTAGHGLRVFSLWLRSSISRVERCSLS